MTRRVRFLLGAVSLAAPWVGGCGGDGVNQTFPQAPVILISIDTLRSDRLPAYGYTGVATPALDGLRQDGILYERAYSHYPLTYPAHASVLTGQLPTVHGVRDNVGYRLDTTTHPYLPKLLQARGYRTGAAVSAYVLEGRHTGLATGFDDYDDAIENSQAGALGAVQRSGDETAKAALDWLGTTDTQKPFLLFFHLYEPHTPYAPPEPFRSRYPDPYVGEVAAADAVVGRFLAELKARGLYDKALIVLFSDHGEGLGDHGEAEHGILLYREALQVPLIVKLPGQALAGRSTAVPAQLVDVVPTVLGAVGVPVPAGLPGVSLLSLLEGGVGDRPIYAESYYSRIHYGWSELTSLIEGPHHLIHGPDPELYDLVQDPAERSNLRDRDRRNFGRLREAVRAQMKELAAPAAADAETAARLAALGYLSSGALAAGDGPLADPKAKVAVLTQLGKARQLAETQRSAEAVAILRPLLAENPRMQDGWTTLGLALLQQGQLSEALPAYQKAVELAGPVPQLLLAVSGVYLQLGRLDEAKSHAELALSSSPTAANLRLAEVARARGQAAEAERLTRAAVASRGTAVAPLLHLAKLLSLQNNLAEAKRLLAEAEAELAKRTSQETPPDLHFVRGDLALREGRLADAARDLTREIEISPRGVDAYASLAFAFAIQGDGNRAAGVLKRMVEVIGTPGAYAAAYQTLEALGDRQQAAQLLAYARQRFPQAEQLRAL